MCGRASLIRTNPDAIADQLDAEVDPRARVDFHDRYNLAPSQRTVIVVPKDGHRLVEPATWGWKRIVGPPREDGKRAEKMINNAMAETAAKKPMFSKALRERRGVMPVSGYYEWFGPKTDRRPIHFTARDGQLLLLAVLWSDEKDQEVPAFTILTTGANEATKPIHDRMPVIIPRARLDEWLLEGGADLLRPAPEDLLAAIEVSKRVNSASNEGPSCWEVDDAPGDAKLRAALSLFPRPGARA